MIPSRARGVTLIELLIALSLGMILILLAAPAYVTWLSDTEESTAAGSIADGLRFATAEAIKRNRNMEFSINAAGWTVNAAGDATVLKDDRRAEGSYRATRTTSPAGNTLITFNSFGNVEPANADATAPFTSINVAVANSSRQATGGLRVLVGNGRTGIKVCDPNPALSYPTDPKACP